MPYALVVEDEPRVADLCAKLLRRAGFEPRVVGSAHEAAAELDGSRRVSFLCADIRLPDGSGLDVAASARRLHPEMPILVATALAGDIVTPDGVVLHKPFTLAQFQAAVEEALCAVARREF
jgi:two-component system cell cycle sensor histidine kinase/response regulator CckA